MANTPIIRTRLVRRARRGAKFARRWSTAVIRGKPNTTPVFVFGMQRSGTGMVLGVLGNSPEIVTYLESHPEYYCDMLLREDAIIQRRLVANPFPIVALKPMCESHRAKEILATFPTARGIWIFRSWRDTVNSAAAKWSSARKQLRLLAEENHEAAGWRAGGVTPQRSALVRGLFRESMSEHAAQAVMWHLRSTLFLDQRLDDHDRVLLVRYEELVRSPERGFSEVFAFLNVHFDPGYVSEVHSSSVDSRPAPPIPAEILEICEATERRLVSARERVGDARSNLSPQA